MKIKHHNLVSIKLKGEKLKSFKSIFSKLEEESHKAGFKQNNSLKEKEIDIIKEINKTLKNENK